MILNFLVERWYQKHRKHEHQPELYSPNIVMQNWSMLDCLDPSQGNNQISVGLRRQMIPSGQYTINKENCSFCLSYDNVKMVFTLTSSIWSKVSHISELIFPLKKDLLLLNFMASSTSLNSDGAANLPSSVFSAKVRRYFKYNLQNQNIKPKIMIRMCMWVQERGNSKTLLYCFHLWFAGFPHCWYHHILLGQIYVADSSKQRSPKILQASQVQVPKI